MWLWVLLFVVLLLAGLVVIARAALGVLREVRHFGRAVADASARVGGAAADLSEASETFREGMRDRDPVTYGVPAARRG